MKSSGKHKESHSEIVQKKKKTLNTLALIKRPSKETLVGKNTRHETEEDEKPSTSTQVKIKQEIDKEMDTTSSSEDEVLCTKKDSIQPEAKRKAEVLSKESGKIGITIKVSPPSSANTTAVAIKEEKPKKEPETIENEQKPETTETDDVPDAKKVKISPEKPVERVSSPIIAANKENSSSSSSSSPTPTTKEDTKPATQTNQSITKEETPSPANNNSKPPEQATPRPTTPKNQPIKQVTEQTSPYHELASPRLWLPKFQLTDQIFITDVTVNSETATIRECKTEKGFFKERAAVQVENNIPVTQA